MKIVPFVAENAANALAQIHEKLGPDAVVLSIRRLPAHGVAWLWNRQGHVEVLAAVLTEPETVEAAKSLPEASALHRPAKSSPTWTCERSWDVLPFQTSV